jgi:8-oxo-dGTP diphosphatase
LADPRRLQFGAHDPALTYKDRPTAFGLLEREGRIACVRIRKPGEAAFHDLPGGALDAGEDAAAAMVREFAEETGLVVEAGEEFAAAAQYLMKTEQGPVNNLCRFFEARLIREDPAAKVEDDHELVWLDPAQTLVRLRHDAHAWAVAAWMRRRAR